MPANGGHFLAKQEVGKIPGLRKSFHLLSFDLKNKLYATERQVSNQPNEARVQNRCAYMP
jgi:hypothetical protein